MADTTAVDLRTTLGAAELPRDVLRVAGPEAVDYLQGQLSQDVAGLAAGASAWSFLLQPTGKVDAWLRVTRTGDDAFVLDVDAGYGEAVVARLRRFLLRTKAEVDMLPWRAVALRGPGADRVDGLAGLVVATWPGVAGVDVLGEDAAVPAGVERATAADLASLRVRAGIPAMGAELSEATIPAEAGRHVVDASVSFTKGCYTARSWWPASTAGGGNVPRARLVLPDTAGCARRRGRRRRRGGQGHLRGPCTGGGAVALALVSGRSSAARGEVGVCGRHRGGRGRDRAV